MTKFESGSMDEWDRILEQLIVGVSHHISNRVAALAGVSDILAEEEGIPPVLRALADEVPKLEESIRLLRLLAAPNELEEAIEPIRLVRDAITMVRLHPVLREVRYRVDGEELPPVLAKPVEVTHQLIVVLVQAAISAGATDGSELVVLARVDGGDVVISAGGGVARMRTLVAARAGDAVR